MIFLTKYYSVDHIGEDQIVGARGINIREDEMHTATMWGNLKVKDHLEDLGADARNI